MGEIGLEPTTSAMSKQCSNQLSYPPEGLTLYRGQAILAIQPLELKKTSRQFSIEENLRDVVLIDFTDHQGDVIGQQTALGEIIEGLAQFLDQLISM